MNGPVGHKDIGELSLSPEFKEKLARYLGEYDPSSAFARRYSTWYEDHLGGRFQWFQRDMLWRLELNGSLAGKVVLDFGCGTGSSSVAIAGKGARVIGTEPDRVSLDVAAQRAKDFRVDSCCTLVQVPYFTDGATSVPFRDESFDLCTMIGVLEHMKSDEMALCVAEINRVLRMGGDVFLFDTPNRAFPKDHHTTQLWFVGFLPRFIARRYAILRKRFDWKQDFDRYGGNGISRKVIDRLFPSTVWRVSYEKSVEEIANEYSWLVAQSILPSFLKKILQPGVRKAMLSFLNMIETLGFRPTYWTATHTIRLTKVSNVPSASRPRSPNKFALVFSKITNNPVNADSIRQLKTKELFVSLFHRIQLFRMKLERISMKLFNRQKPRILATACWNFPIYSQTFVYQELTQLIDQGFALRFFYSKRNSRKEISAQFNPLWRRKRKLIQHPINCQRDYDYFTSRMPEKIQRLVEIVCNASGISARELKNHHHFMQAFSFVRMVEAYRPDYLHSYFFYEGTLFTFFASYLLDIPRGVSCYSDHMLNDYALKLVPMHLDQCSLIVATSQQIKKELIAIAPNLDADKVLIKPNAINADHFQAVNPKEPRNGQSYQLISVSRIEPKKGLIYLAEAVRQIRDKNLDVNWHHIGTTDNNDSSKDYAEELEARINELGISDIVHFEGRKSQAEIREFFKASHIFVAPFIQTDSGDKDGIPTSVLEAMSSGLPVVATNAGSIHEVVEQNEDGVVVLQRDPTELCNAIVTLIGDKERRRYLGANASIKVRQHYDTRVCEQIFHNRIRKILLQ